MKARICFRDALLAAVAACLTACGGQIDPEPICFLPPKVAIDGSLCKIPAIGPRACPAPAHDTVYVVDGIDVICCQIEIGCPRLGGAP